MWTMIKQKNRADKTIRSCLDFPMLIITASIIDIPTAETIKYLYIVGKIDVGTHHHAKRKEQIDQERPKNNPVDIFFCLKNLIMRKTAKMIEEPPIRTNKKYLLLEKDALLN